jgi:hypothetical protein
VEEARELVGLGEPSGGFLEQPDADHASVQVEQRRVVDHRRAGPHGASPERS